MAMTVLRCRNVTVENIREIYKEIAIKIGPTIRGLPFPGMEEDSTVCVRRVQWHTSFRQKAHDRCQNPRRVSDTFPENFPEETDGRDKTDERREAETFALSSKRRQRGGAAGISYDPRIRYTIYVYFMQLTASWSRL